LPDYGKQVYRTLSLGLETSTQIGFIYTDVKSKYQLEETLTFKGSHV